MPKEIKALGWAVGTWSGKCKIAFGGRETEIATTMTVSFDGQFLKSVSKDVSAGYTLSKTTMTGWDEVKAEYVSYTFTNMAPTARIAHGKMDGKALTMVAEPWKAEGMTMVSRETLRSLTATTCSLVMEFKSGDKWVKGMDVVLTKQPDAKG